MSALEAILEPLKTDPPSVDESQAREIARRHYGLDVEVSGFISERDRNFHLRAVNGEQYVLKVTNPAEDPDVAIFQARALNHIAVRDPGLPVPRVIETLAGQHSFVLAHQDDNLLIRLFTYLQGEPLAKAPHSARQRYRIGEISARMSLALSDFTHPAADHLILWDIKNARHLRGLLQYIPDNADQALATEFLDRFEEHVLPALPGFRSQVVHNDLNPQNLLVEPGTPDVVAGVLDFGDMVRTPLVNDVAVTCSYLLAPTQVPLAPVVEMLAGYQSILALQADELALLADLIATRYVMNVAITGWRAARYPDNRDYILRNTSAAWAGLRCLRQHDRRDLQAYLQRECASLKKGGNRV